MNAEAMQERFISLAAEAVNIALTTEDEQRAEDALRCVLSASAGYHALRELELLDRQIAARFN